MKKNYIFTLLLTFCLCSVSFGQEMLLNGGLENWTDDTTPSDWSKAENTTKESTEKRTGNFSAKMTGGTKDLAQTITGIVAGDSYTITLWYKVESGDDTDARIWSYWKDAANANIDNNDNDSEDAIRGPNNGYLDNNGNVWTKYETTITAPSGATQFYFELRVYGSAVVYWDDLSFMHNVEGTAPVLSISSPANNSEIESTTSVDVSVSVSNFVVGAVGGTGVDGHIHWTLQKNSDAAVAQPMKYNTDDETITVEPGNTYTVFMEFVDDSHTPINPAVSATSTFTIKNPCDLVLGAIETTCDAITSGTDTYSGSIAFTGGNTGITYTIAAPSGVTVGGDNPNSIASGTITFSGMTEGIDAAITIVGGSGSSCDLSRTLYSPTCTPLPIIEDFNYVDGSLINNPLWSNFSGTSGDLMVSSEQVLVQHGTPSEDAQIQFAAVSGSVYYALDFTVVNPGSPISGTDNEYFATFKDGSFGFSGRLDIVPPSGTGDFSVGIATDGATADSVWATDLSYGIKYRATVKFNQDTNIAQLWINAIQETDTSILGADLDDPGRSIVSFALRQSDSSLNEGILVDNLRIGTTFAETSLATVKTEILGFDTYPNPITNKEFTITSNNASVKQLSIFNVLGKKVMSTNFSGTKSTIDVSSITAGIYILKVTEEGKTATKKLVIR